MEESKVLILGFDGLDFDYLDAFADSLPNFTAVRNQGVEARLKSTFPPMTPSAWPSLYTGGDPSCHGVFHFLDFPNGYPNKSRNIDRTNVKLPAIWNYLTSLGDESIVFNVPVTHPPESINGVVIPGFPASEDTDGHPPEIRAEISEAIGEEYRIYPEEDTVEEYEDLIKMRRRASEYLLTEYDWKFAFLQLQKTDSVFHQLDNKNDFRHIYEAADAFLGEVLTHADEDTHVLICSDHGMGHTKGKKVYLNEILREEGFVKYQGRDKEQNELTPLNGRSQQVGLIMRFAHKIAENIGIDSIIRSLFPENNLKEFAETPIDFEQSKAYCRSGTELGIRINLEGREQNGVVPRDEYESIRSELINTLSTLKTPKGNKAFSFVKRREEVYQNGDYLDNSCDIVLMPFEKGNVISHKSYGVRFADNETFEHRTEGVFIGNGPKFKDEKIDSIDITDIGPMTMRLLNYAIPKRMTGEIPPNLDVTNERDEYSNVTYAEVNSTEESVEDRLEDLGYL